MKSRDQTIVEAEWHPRHVWMPTCEEAVRLQSEALDRPLPWPQRVGLGFHLWICSLCRRYGRQIRRIRRMLRSAEAREAALPGPGLSAVSAARLKTALRTAQSG